MFSFRNRSEVKGRVPGKTPSTGSTLLTKRSFPAIKAHKEVQLTFDLLGDCERPPLAGLQTIFRRAIEATELALI